MPSPETRGAGRAAPRLRQAVCLILGLALAWQIVAAGFSARLLRARDFAAAGRVAPWSAAAPGGQALQALGAGQDGEAAARARQALSIAPVDQRAAGVLGVAADAAGRHDAAFAIMAAAGALGWRDDMTQIWLLNKSIAAGDARVVMERADALLRRNVMRTELFDLLRKLVVAPAFNAEFAGRLTQVPDWRAGYLAEAGKASPDQLPGFESLLLRLASTSAPPDVAEARSLLARLAGSGEYRRAHALWVRLGGSDLVYDGGFEKSDQGLPSSTGPFEWRASKLIGVTASIQRPDRPGKGLALHIASDGLAAGSILAQSLMLAPARYRLTASAMASGADASVSAAWRITCLGSKVDVLAPTAQIPAGTNGWRNSTYLFEVPGGCHVQQLELRLAGPQGHAFDLWIDDLAIVPIGPRG